MQVSMPAGAPQTGLVIATNYTKGQGEWEGDKKGENLESEVSGIDKDQLTVDLKIRRLSFKV